MIRALFLIFFSLICCKGIAKPSNKKNFKENLLKVVVSKQEINYFANKDIYYSFIEIEKIKNTYPEITVPATRSQGGDPIEGIQRACDRLGEYHSICGQYNVVKNNIEKFGKEIVSNIPYPTAAAVSTFMLKTFSEQKVSLDINDKNFFNPKIEVSPNRANLNFNYSW